VANSNNHTTAPIGFESELWRAADALRSNMDAAEYKHAALSPNLDCITGECHATT
jgi:type I restriction-modification system DNA methylase subunit